MNITPGLLQYAKGLQEKYGADSEIKSLWIGVPPKLGKKSLWKGGPVGRVEAFPATRRSPAGYHTYFRLGDFIPAIEAYLETHGESHEEG